MKNLIQKKFLNQIENTIKREKIYFSNLLISHLKETSNEYIFNNYIKEGIYNKKLKKIEIIVIDRTAFINWYNTQKTRHQEKEKYKTRSECALNGIETHQRNTQFNFLILKNELYKSPKIINFNKNKYDFNHINEKLLIIENLDLFYQFEKIKTKFNIKYKEFDIVYGSGNSITNKYYYNFFNNYKKIFTLLDIDNGGFKIYKTLKKNLKSSIINLYPFNIELYFKKSIWKHSFNNISKYTNDNSKILNKEDINVLNLIKKYEQGIEQEIYLNTIKENI